MKALKIFNTIAIAIPILIACFGFFDPSAFLLAIVSIILTGLIQTIVAAVFWFKNKGNRFIPLYFVISLLFFVFTFGVHKFDLDDVFTFPFWIAPTFLCIYLSLIVYTSKSPSSEEKKQG